MKLNKINSTKLNENAHLDSVETLVKTADKPNPVYTDAVGDLEKVAKANNTNCTKKTKEDIKILGDNATDKTSDIDAALKASGVKAIEESLLKEGLTPITTNNLVSVKIKDRVSLHKLAESARNMDLNYLVKRLTEADAKYEFTFITEAVEILNETKKDVDCENNDCDKSVEEACKKTNLDESSKEEEPKFAKINVNGAKHAKVGDKVDDKEVIEVVPTRDPKFEVFNTDETNPIWFDVVYNDDTVDTVVRKNVKETKDESLTEATAVAKKSKKKVKEPILRDLWDQVYCSLTDAGDNRAYAMVGGKGKYGILDINNAGEKDGNDIIVITDSNHEIAMEIASKFELETEEEGSNFYIYIPKNAEVNWELVPEDLRPADWKKDSEEIKTEDEPTEETELANEEETPIEEPINDEPAVESESELSEVPEESEDSIFSTIDDEEPIIDDDFVIEDSEPETDDDTELVTEAINKSESIIDPIDDSFDEIDDKDEIERFAKDDIDQEDEDNEEDDDYEYERAKEELDELDLDLTAYDYYRGYMDELHFEGNSSYKSYYDILNDARSIASHSVDTLGEDDLDTELDENDESEVAEETETVIPSNELDNNEIMKKIKTSGKEEDFKKLLDEIYLNPTEDDILEILADEDWVLSVLGIKE